MERMYKIIGADREEYGAGQRRSDRACSTKAAPWPDNGAGRGQRGLETAFRLSRIRDGCSRSRRTTDECASPRDRARPGAPLRPDVPTYLLWSILITSCALVVGFPAIYYSTQS